MSGGSIEIGDTVVVTVLHAEREADDGRVYLVTTGEEYAGEVKWREAVAIHDDSVAQPR